MRKVAISKAIVEAIYSKEPPGRFLRKCAKTGKWEELSKREAYNKAAQAMAYAVRDMEKRGQSHAVPSQINLPRSTDGESEQITYQDETADNSTDPSLQLQRLLNQPQQFSTASLQASLNPTLAMPVASLNGLSQLLNLEQQQHQQTQQLLLSLIGLGQPQPQHAFASVPPNLSQLINPSSSVQSQVTLLNDIDILQQAFSSSSSLQGSIANLLGIQSIPSRPEPSLTRVIPQSQTGLPQQLSVNQLQHRLDALLQNQLLPSLVQNQWLLQQPSRPLDLLHQALPSLFQLNGSQNLTNVQPLLSPMITSSSPSSSTRQDEEEEGKERESEG